MQSTIERRVMAGVGVVYAARLLASRIAIELYALALSGLALWQLTWVHRVAANFVNVERGGFGSIATYLSYAFLHTHLATQLALVVAAVAAAAFAVDAVRSLATSRRTLAY